MLVKTRGIVLKYFKYRDTSIIAKIYTADLGSRSYIINGVRAPKARFKIALFQPLTNLELVVYERSGKDLQRINELKCTTPLQTIPYDIRKSAIGIFIGELLYKCLKEESPATDLYEFLANAISVLDHLEANFTSFHLQFLIKFSKYLGFDIVEADHLVTHSFEYDIKRLSQLTYFEAPLLANSHRAEILDYIIDFYTQNVDGLSDIQSLKVLKEIGR